MAQGKLSKLDNSLARKLEKQGQRSGYKPSAAPATPAPVEEGDKFLWLDVDLLEDNPYQPRRIYNPEAQARLVEDLNRDGQLQPAAARPHPTKPGYYQLILGHRRKYAVKDGAPVAEGEPGKPGRVVVANAGSRLPQPTRYAGKLHVQVKHRPISEMEMRRWAYRENKSREDTSPIEDARFYVDTREALTKELQAAGELKPNTSASWRALAEVLGESHGHVFRVAQLLSLPPKFVTALEEGRINERHGRALLTLKEHPLEQENLLHVILEQNIDGATTERMALAKLKEVGDPSVESGPEDSASRQRRNGSKGRTRKLNQITPSGSDPLILPETVGEQIALGTTSVRAAIDGLGRAKISVQERKAYEAALTELENEVKQAKQILRSL